MQHAVGLLTTSLQPLRSRLYTNAAYLWLGEIGFAALGFVFWNVVARLYPPETVGLAGTAVISITMLAMVASLGLGEAFVRFMPQDGDEARLMLGRCLAIMPAAAVLVGLMSTTEPSARIVRQLAPYASKS